LPDASADLITVAQAAHWLDLEAFYAEVRRVARPRAILALISYGVLEVADARADAVVRDFYRDVLGPHWPPERRHVEDGYRTLAFPFAEIPFAEIPAPALSIEVAWGLDDLIGYTETWSAVRAAERALGRGPITAFRAALAEAWGEPEERRGVRWPLSLRVGRL
jgi:SAM-dependent methyltransferase